jgi:hypothetical protein
MDDILLGVLIASLPILFIGIAMAVSLVMSLKRMECPVNVRKKVERESE